MRRYMRFVNEHISAHTLKGATGQGGKGRERQQYKLTRAIDTIATWISTRDAVHFISFILPAAS